MKKSIVILAVSTLVVACAGRQEKNEVDTTSTFALADSLPFGLEDDSVYVNAADPEELDDVVRQMIGSVNIGDPEYSLSVQASGYEFQTEGVWQFDSLKTLRYCFQKWSSEGATGESHHFFRRGRLYALREEHGDDREKRIHLFHRELGGVSIVDPDSSNAVSSLRKVAVIDSQDQIKSELNELIRMMRDHREEIKPGEAATLTVAAEADEDPSTMETLEITVDEKLLKELLDDH